MSAVDPDKQGEAWKAINPDMSDSDTIALLIDNSLRRSRFLIDLCEKTNSCAMNRGHAVVTPEDVEEGLRLMARYLVSDFAYEMRDVAGTPEKHPLFLHWSSRVAIRKQKLKTSSPAISLARTSQKL